MASGGGPPPGDVALLVGQRDDPRYAICSRSTWKTFEKSRHIGVNGYDAALRGNFNLSGSPDLEPGTSCTSSDWSSSANRWTRWYLAPLNPTRRLRTVISGSGRRRNRNRSPRGSHCRSRGVRYRNCRSGHSS